MIQYLSYCAMMGKTPIIDRQKLALVRFDIGEEKSKEAETIGFLVEDVGLKSACTSLMQIFLY